MKRRSLIIYLLFMVLMVLTIHNKKNLYIDEVCSYGLANHADGPYMTIEDGKTYYPSGTPWTEFMTVNPEHRFEYGIVWSNQGEDVHPPLYYLFLHTICSFFPNSFSIWFAAVINIVFALGTLYFMRKIVFALTADEWIQNIVSIVFVCSTGILSAVSFLRMYIMAMFWVTALTCLLIRQAGEAHSKKFYIFLTLYTACGALTHYYCIVYAVFISVAYGCYLLYQKRFKETGLFCAAQAAAGLISVAVFPKMLYHILDSGRGEQSVDNLLGSSVEIWITRVRLYYKILNQQLFGNILTYIVLAMILVLFVYGMHTGGRLLNDERKITVVRYLISIIPIIFYFILIAKISVYLTDRYMYPIYAVGVGAILSGIGGWLKDMSRKYYVYIISGIIAVMIVNNWSSADWGYLYDSSIPLLEKASEYEDVDCIFVYGKQWEPNPAYYEASKYHSVTFFTKGDLELLESMDPASRYHLILMTTGDDEEVIEEISAICPELSCSEYLGGYAYTNTYYLSD